MANNDLASLAELLPDTDLRCRIKGCKNLWSIEGKAILDALADDAGRLPERMCTNCFEAFKKLEDQDVPCTAPGCQHTWKWNRFQQLEAHVRGYTTPPKRFCKECEAKKRETEAQEIPCRLRECDRTWTWSPRQQMTWHGDKPPQRLCDECNRILYGLTDLEVPCRMRGCSRTWVWTRYQQLEQERAGKDIQKPPRRMCRECFEKLKTLEDLELKCNTENCSRTWVFNRFAQLENILRNGPDASPPPRLCNACMEFLKRTHDRHRRCIISGCKNSWLYTRKQQVQDWLGGKTEAPEKMCDSCGDELNKYLPVPAPCSVPGCNDTWLYTPLEQLKDAHRRHRKPRQHRCEACEKFLLENQTRTLICGECAGTIKWSAYEQLLVDRGSFAKPVLCPDCADKKFHVDKTEKSMPEDHHHVVKIPPGGKWGADRQIAQWPPHLDHAVIEKAEQADLRIVTLGDVQTYSSGKLEESWPFLLEQYLNRRLADDGITAAVVNAGIPGTTSAQALKRLPRDVWPFAPHLILLSFICGDSLIDTNGHGDRRKYDLEVTDKGIRQLCRMLKEKSRLIYWTPNPVYPLEMIGDEKAAYTREWANTQQNRRNQVQTHTLRICQKLDIPVVDLNARFEVNGSRSARKWMSNWHRHNATGARNIATWMADYIMTSHRDTLADI